MYLIHPYVVIPATWSWVEINNLLVEDANIMFVLPDGKTTLHSIEMNTLHIFNIYISTIKFKTTPPPVLRGVIWKCVNLKFVQLPLRGWGEHVGFPPINPHFP